MNQQFLDYLTSETIKLKEQGLYKTERIITSPQNTFIQTEKGNSVLNLCANNYLGLANHPEIIEAAIVALNQYGYGMSSVRFICGTQVIHKLLEQNISQYLRTEDTILYSSCFDANTGLFETIFDEKDAIISDALNHASIIDGIRLCKATRFRYENNNMKNLEQILKDTGQYRFRLIATDGVFSMDGVMANLPAICELAKTYNAMIMVDDSHAIGVLGPNGRGTPFHFGVSQHIDIYTGTFGKALGGASGGYTSSRKEIITWLRQRSRPYLFSNTLAPVIAATSLGVIKMLELAADLQEKLLKNSLYFRAGLHKLGFNLIPGEHPIIPIMLNDAKLAASFADDLLKEGVYVVSFSYPVVPVDMARIRTQMSAAHQPEELDQALQAFEKVGKKLGVIR